MQIGLVAPEPALPPLPPEEETGLMGTRGEPVRIALRAPGGGEAARP